MRGGTDPARTKRRQARRGRAAGRGSGVARRAAQRRARRGSAPRSPHCRFRPRRATARATWPSVRAPASVVAAADRPCTPGGCRSAGRRAAPTNATSPKAREPTRAARLRPRRDGEPHDRRRRSRATASRQLCQVVRRRSSGGIPRPHGTFGRGTAIAPMRVRTSTTSGAACCCWNLASSRRPAASDGSCAQAARRSRRSRDSP